VCTLPIEPFGAHSQLLLERAAAGGAAGGAAGAVAELQGGWTGSCRTRGGLPRNCRVDLVVKGSTRTAASAAVHRLRCGRLSAHTLLARVAGTGFVLTYSGCLKEWLNVPFATFGHIKRAAVARRVTWDTANYVTKTVLQPVDVLYAAGAPPSEDPSADPLRSTGSIAWYSGLATPLAQWAPRPEQVLFNLLRPGQTVLGTAAPYPGLHPNTVEVADSSCQVRSHRRRPALL